MATEASIKERMLKDGFSIIEKYDDPAGAVFPDHDHPGDQLLVVIKGSIEIIMEGKTTTLKVGDELFFPANVVHSAKVSPEGCLYLVGERPTIQK